MAEKAKCSICNERDVFSKGMCSGCYGRQWREQRKVERAAAIAEQFPPKQLTAGEPESIAIEGEIVHDGEQVKVPETHLVATNPVEMQAAKGDVKAWLEQRLTVIERDIVEANAALNEARRNGWATAAFTSARNRAVDEETFYSKVLIAVEAGYAMIPDFPIQVFAVRRGEADKAIRRGWQGYVEHGPDSWLRAPLQSDCAPAGAGEYRTPEPEVQTWNGPARKNEKGETYYPYYARRTGRPRGPMTFPSMTARSPVMRAASDAMKEKVFDQVGVCLPTVAVAATRQVERPSQQSARTGDPLVIGQILHKRVGSKQKIVSFIIAWHLNLNDL